MINHIRTQNLFNMGTQRALYERTRGYVSKEIYIQEHIDRIKKEYSLDRIVRLDLGQNNDGCDAGVVRNFGKLVSEDSVRGYIKNYPEVLCRTLRSRISELHGIDKDWILLSAGLDQMLIMISSAFLEINDRVIVNTPSFFLYEEYSKRMGAIPVWLKLHERDNYRWTSETLEQYVTVLKRLHPKLIWLANPNNPTGVAVPEESLKFIIEEASRHYAFIVVDEAYGEYTDPDNGVNSASKYLSKYSNLLVLRTFSKCYGLANLRVGYAMSRDPDIFEALRIHRPYYPITQFSFDLAAEAIEHLDFLEKTRKRVAERKRELYGILDEMPSVRYVPSDTGIIMMRHEDYSSDGLIGALERHGIIVAGVEGAEETAASSIRVTIGNTDEMSSFVEALSTL